MTYREARMQAAKQLAAAGVENEAAESWFLMEAVCGISRSFYLLHEQEAMDPVQEQVYFALTRQRCGRMPLQYLTGEQEFMGLPFCVNEHVLIPRQDTEVLVEEAIRVIQKEMPEAAVLDLCTGSGCIGISIQSFCSNTQVTAADISDFFFHFRLAKYRIFHYREQFFLHMRKLWFFGFLKCQWATKLHSLNAQSSC